MKAIEVVISPDGSEVVVEVNGVKGASCENLTEQLTKALGTVQKSKHTSEYYEAPIFNEVKIGGN